MKVGHISSCHRHASLHDRQAIRLDVHLDDRHDYVGQLHSHASRHDRQAICLDFQQLADVGQFADRHAGSCPEELEIKLTYKIILRRQLHDDAKWNLQQ